MTARISISIGAVLVTLFAGTATRVLSQPLVSSGEFFGGGTSAEAVRFGVWDFDRCTEAHLRS